MQPLLHTPERHRKSSGRNTCQAFSSLLRYSRRVVAPDYPTPRLSSRPRDTIEIIQPCEHIARLRSFWGATDARRVQLVDDASGTPVANLEAALKQRRRTLLVLNHHLGGLAEQLVPIGIVEVIGVAAACFFGLL